MTGPIPSETSDRATVAWVIALLAVPWSVQVFATGDIAFVFAWGLVATDPFHVTSLVVFLGATAGLPAYILAWPTSVLLWALALASALLGASTGREDPRVTAGLLVLAGIAQLSVAGGFSVQPGRLAVPAGTVACWVVAWWRYGPRRR